MRCAHAVSALLLAGLLTAQDPDPNFARRLIDAAARSEDTAPLAATDPARAAFVARDLLRAAASDPDARRADWALAIADGLPDPTARADLLADIARWRARDAASRELAASFENAVARAQSALVAGELETAVDGAARAIDHAVALDDRYLQARARSLHAAILRARGERTPAIAELETAIELGSEVRATFELAADRGALAHLFEERAATHDRSADYERTRDDLSAAIALWRALDSAPDEGRALVRLGGVLNELALFPDAEKALARALKLLSDPGPTRARALLAFGVCLLDQNHTGEAIELLLAARAMSASERVGAAAIAHQLARALLAVGEYDAALRAADEAVERLGDDGDPLSRALAESTCGDAAQALGEELVATAHYRRALDLGRDRPEATWRAHVGLGRLAESTRPRDALGSYRAAITGLEALRELIRAPDLRTRALAERRAPYFRAARLFAQSGEHDELFAMLEALHARTLWELGPPNPVSGAARREVLHGRTLPALAAVRSALRPNEVLLEFGVGDDSTLCQVVTASAVRALELPHGAAAWQALVDVLLEPIDDLVAGRIDVSNLRFPARTAHELASRLLEPLRLERGTRLWIVADGPLRQVPFPALVLEHAVRPVRATAAYGQYDGCRYLIEDHELAVLPIAALLVERARSREATGTPLIVGNRLAGAVREARAVAEALAVAPLLDDDAGETACRSRLGEARVAHFAGHAELDARRPERSRLEVAADAQHDGWLSATEIEALDLACDTVVLSGCATAGAAASSDGLLGLTRAFLAAGAGTVVAATWPVDDRATADLMVDFHRRAQSEAPIAALRAAQLAMLARGRDSGLACAHPFFWAGFLVHGAR